MIYILYIVSMIQGMPDIQIGTYNSEYACLSEVQRIIQQGPSAYCDARSGEE